MTTAAFFVFSHPLARPKSSFFPILSYNPVGVGDGTEVGQGKYNVFHCVEQAPSHFVLQTVVSAMPVHPHGFVTVFCTIQSGVRHVLGQPGPSLLVIVTHEMGEVAVLDRVMVVNVGVGVQRLLVS